MNSDIRSARVGISRMKSVDVDSSDQHFIVLSLLHKWLEDLALPHASGVMLDFGCGGQPYKTLFGSRVARYIGADVAASKDVHLDIEMAPGEPVPLADASVDTILSTQTLEHVYDFQFYMRECHRLLKPGGILILTVPMQWRVHEAPCDYWRFTRYGVAELMARNDLAVINITPCGGVCALVGQIVNSHLAVHRRGSKLIYRFINRLALALDRRFPDADETLLWMCLSQKPLSQKPECVPPAGKTASTTSLQSAP
ncbi:MAG: putative S-adenosylmethionine-dependent methyltransferase [Syntrophomonadaceae bacterium]|nr:putative S-adenosylmethionine-dependent methyltransferase [Bacillota bacterium]